MAGWLTYLMQRSPPAALTVVAGGIALSGVWIGDGVFDATRFALVFAGLFVFMVLARLADELKDYQKDQFAHPDRPLPRGVVTLASARRVRGMLFVATAAYAAVLAVAAGWRAGALYGAAAAWLWLMSHEFFAAERLATRPLVSAILHQLVLLPLYTFAIAAQEPEAVVTPAGIAYVVANLGASLSYEIGRKLDPAAHPVLGYYAARYGIRRCAAMIALSLIVAGVSSWWLAAAALWPVEAAVLAAVMVVILRPDMHRAVERAAAVSVLIHVWAIPINRIVERLG
jgi:4-hydroxybenzoate polyprenyltransferase